MEKSDPPTSDRITRMLQKTSDPPRILRNSAGRTTCSIFRVPHSLKEINPNNYGPHVVSIGPYHHGASHLKMIEEHKWRFLGSLLKRIEITRSIGLEQLVSAVRAVEESARDCYSSCFDYSTDEFAEMLVLDGCFLIEFLRKYNGIIPFERNDPLVSVSWIFSFFLRDFINLENQVPFFILQLLFDLTKNPTTESHVSLSILALMFFNDAFERPEELIGNYQNPAVQHLLDLLRSSFIPTGYEEPTVTRFPNTRLIKCISKLRRAGIKFRPNTHDSFLAVTFRHGVIYMGTITLDDFMSSFLHNCVAYEQCRRACSKHMTTYATFLDCLINSGGDVGYLSRSCSIRYMIIIITIGMFTGRPSNSSTSIRHGRLSRPWPPLFYSPSRWCRPFTPFCPMSGSPAESQLRCAAYT